jgi:hypothetical protein
MSVFMESPHCSSLSRLDELWPWRRLTDRA